MVKYFFYVHVPEKIWQFSPLLLRHLVEETRLPRILLNSPTVLKFSVVYGFHPVYSTIEKRIKMNSKPMARADKDRPEQV